MRRRQYHLGPCRVRRTPNARALEAASCFVAGSIGDHDLASIEFKLSFLRPAHIGDQPLVARASLVKEGRRVAFVETEVTQGERLVARGSFSYLVT